MGNSNGEWGEYASDPAAAARWDAYAALPDPPEDNKALQGWMEKKGLEYADLLRIGARWGSMGGKPCLVYFFPDGLKYRTLDGHRKTEEGVTFDRFKFIKSADSDGSVVVAEGETDGALLSRLVPHSDVAILPAGAKHVTDTMLEELGLYDQVWVGLDNDEAGNEGAQRLPGVRVVPPEGYVDWCDAMAAGVLAPELDLSSFAVRANVAVPVFSVREVLAASLGTYEDNNWFDQGIVPVGGEVAIHGPMKSYKSFTILELGRAIATGTAFAKSQEFIHPSGFGKVLLIQMEVPPYYFQQRLQVMVDDMPVAERDRFMDNFFVYQIANNKLPRLKVNQPGFQALLRNAADSCGADVVMFDPVQRLVGTASLDKTHEIEPMLDAFVQLQDTGRTVVYCHHDNKSSSKSDHANPYGMAGSQRFGADADSICSVYHNPKVHAEDERNLDWTLRNGKADGVMIRVTPHTRDPRLPHVEFLPKPSAPAPATVPATTATGGTLPSIS